MKLEELKKLERIEELDERAFQLTNHFKGINGWIENNKNTDPNFHEMTECLTEYASLASEYYDCCEKSGYITDTYGDAKLGASKRYELLSEFNTLNEVRDEVYKMFALRNDSAFFEDREAKEFSDNLMIQATIGGYNNPEDARIAEIKKFVLKKVAGVYFYIWQVKQSNPNYQYDNVSEWEELQEAYREYKEAVGKEETIRNYSGPQFGKEIENMFTVIEDNYKFGHKEEKDEVKEEPVESASKLATLNSRASELANRFRGINGWIEANLNTDPNFHEMTECLVEYASLAAEFYDFYEKSGYIRSVFGKDELGASKKYEMLSFSNELKDAREEVYKMFNLRSNSPFFKDKEAKEFVSNIVFDSTIGDYKNPEDARIAEIKKFVLKKVAGVYFYIWQVKQTNPDYQYDNVSEWEELQEAYREYKDAVGKEETKGDYSGPQYGKEIENMFAVIEKNYKFSETKDEESSKEEVETSEELEEINRQAEELTNRFRGINSWIEANLNTDPNFHEMVDCMVEYGKLAKQYDKYYQKAGYPTFDNGSEEVEATHYHLALVSPKLKEAQSELSKMWNLRRKSPFFEDETVREFTTELSMRTQIAEYNVPEDKEIERIKKEVLCKTASIYFYIWQVKQTNPDYQYDNEAEWNNLLQAYEIYKDAVGVEVAYSNSSNTEKYEGPQFGRELEKMHKEINKSYKYSDTEEKQY